VQPLAFAGQQVVVERFADEGMPEPAAGLVEDQQLPGSGLPQRVGDLRRRLVGDVREQLVVDGLSEHRGLVQHGRRWRGQLAHPGQDRVREGGREAAPHPRCGH
jgi:hypothetical protein